MSEVVTYDARGKRVAKALCAESPGAEWVVRRARSWRVASLLAALEVARRDRVLPLDCPPAGVRQHFAGPVIVGELPRE